MNFYSHPPTHHHLFSNIFLCFILNLWIHINLNIIFFGEGYWFLSHRLISFAQISIILISIFLFQFCSTLRYNKLLGEIKKNDKISFREFTNMILKISDVAFPKKTPVNRMVQLLTVMEKWVSKSDSIIPKKNYCDLFLLIWWFCLQ